MPDDGAAIAQFRWKAGGFEPQVAAANGRRKVQGIVFKKSSAGHSPCASELIPFEGQ